MMRTDIGHLVTSLPTALHLETSHTSYTIIPCSVSSHHAYTNPLLADVTCIFQELEQLVTPHTCVSDVSSLLMWSVPLRSSDSPCLLICQKGLQLLKSFPDPSFSLPQGSPDEN